MQRKKKRLLVVDDEQDILEFLKIILEEDGYTVDTTDKDDYQEKLNNDIQGKMDGRLSNISKCKRRPNTFLSFCSRLIQVRKDSQSKQEPMIS